MTQARSADAAPASSPPTDPLAEDVDLRAALNRYVPIVSWLPVYDRAGLASTRSPASWAGG